MDEPLVRKFLMRDGYPVHAVTWLARGGRRGRILVLHGVQSHAGWYDGLGRILGDRGYDATFADRRGSGSNRLDRGHTPSWRRLVSDVGDTLGQLREESPSVPTALAGISWGGKLAMLAAAEFPESVDALALICPGLHARVRPPLRQRLGIAWSLLTGRPKRPFPIPLADPALFTDNPEARGFIAGDPLTLRTATAGLLAASVFIDRQVARSPGRVSQPSLLMLAGRDRIVDNAQTRRLFDRLAAPDRRTLVYPSGHHTLEFDPDAGRYAADLADWLDQVLGHRQP